MSRDASVENVRPKRPAATTSTSDRAIWPTTSGPDTAPRRVVRLWLVCATASAASRRRARHAGTRPKPTAVSTDSADREPEQPPVDGQRERDRLVGGAELG